ncbi:MAG: AraC family transcriptional regulator [Firmicutes bacterium]|nr:AraC family transcriptional regulator [Bacillota bacterium]
MICPREDPVVLCRMVDNNNGDLGFFIRKYSIDSGRTPVLHTHDSIQIDYIYSGSARHMVHDNVCDVVHGDIFVIPPFVPHLLSRAEQTDAEVIEFEFLPSFINQAFDRVTTSEAFWDFAYIEPFLVEENLVKPRLNLAGKIQVEVENLLNEALRENELRRPGFELLIKSLLLKLLVIVGRELTDDLTDSKTRPLFDRHRDAIKGAINYIEEHFTENLTIDSVAKMFMLSPSFFGYLFKNLTSKTFTEYLKDLRIAKAAEMLKTSDKKVIEICYESGFNNLNHFNRTFKQSVGVSPGAYRRENS